MCAFRACFTCKTDNTGVHSGNLPDVHSLKCQTDRSSILADHIDPTTAPMLGIPTGKVAENIAKTPLNASDDSNAHMQGQLFVLAQCQCSYFHSPFNQFEAEK